jgi:hypothetical protein
MSARTTPTAALRRVLLMPVLYVLCSGPVAAAGWSDYQIIEWQPRGAAALAMLKSIGVTAGMVFVGRDGPPAREQYASLLTANMQWYVENIATDFYSAYHRWDPHRPVNWRFIEVQRRYRSDPSDQSALLRDPSLSDPAWQQRVRDRLIATVGDQRRYRPLFYNLGDEPGIADLAAFWDFDFSPVSLAGMREWLRSRYGSLAALNAEWGAAFARWDDVLPETTRQAMRRTDGNFAAWADFRAWMDEAFARALRMGTDAVHEADPGALAGIEGAQIPGWGGYDYTLLANAVDLMEIYDAGDNLPIAVSLNPKLIALTTAFSADRPSMHAIWRELLRGSRGLILWDKDPEIVRDDGSLADRGRAYGPLFAELRGPLGSLLVNSAPRTDPVAILYSPTSFRTQWMLDQQPKGDAWMLRGSETELDSNAVRTTLGGYLHTLAHLGLQPRFLSPDMLAHADLGEDKLLILPHSIALSPAEAHAIRAFGARGNVVVADTPPGVFDAHSRRLPGPQVESGFTMLAADDAAGLGRALRQAGVEPLVRLDRTDLEIHTFRHAHETIIALQRELSPSEATEATALTLPRPLSVYDLSRNQALGRVQHLRLQIDPVTPTVLSIEEADP